MRLRLLIMSIVSIISIESIHCQTNIDYLNYLPRTLTVSAPEFNTEKEYFFRVDTCMNNLFIQDLRISDKGQIHFYQWLYEIPLDNLSAESFSLQRYQDEFFLNISVFNDKKTILKYMFQKGRVSSILCGPSVSLGNWTYSDSLFKATESIIHTIANLFPSTTDTIIADYTDEIKYTAKNVTAVNPTYSNDLIIGNGYYFRQFVQDDNSYLSNRIVRILKETLKNNKIELNYPLPVIIYVNNKDDVTVYVMCSDRIIYINNVDLDIKLFENLSVPTKFVFLFQ